MSRHWMRLACWHVKIDRHSVPPRWLIPATSTIVPAADADHAREIVARSVHIRAGCPPWKPLLRISWPHSSATPTSAAPAVPVVPRRDQLELELEIAA